MGDIRPENIATNDAKALEDFLARNPDIEFIRLQFLNYAAVLSVRVATIPFAFSLIKEGKPVTIPSPILTAIVIDRNILWDELVFGGDGLWPDWLTLKVCHYHPNHAEVMCFVDESKHVAPGDGFKRCPRSRLLEFTKDAKATHGLDFLFGTEVEFMIMEEGCKEVTMTSNAYSAASLNNKFLPVVEDIVRCIAKSGIPVRQFHSEGANGMFELSTEPLPPLQAADALVYCHETIRVVCRKYGLHGTVFPKPFENGSGIGQHHHLSISPKTKEDCFLAGLLDHWRALSAFYMPNYDSNARVRPGTQVTWGTENRCTMIRKIKTGHWELRGIDGTANPHLAMLAILTAGILGWESGQELKMKDCQKMIFFKDLDEKEAEEHGVTETMPLTLKESLKALRDDTKLVERLGPEIIDKYLLMKEKENDNFAKLSLQERKEISMQLY